MNIKDFKKAIALDKESGARVAAEQRFRDAVADGIDHLPKQDWDKAQRLGDAMEEIGENIGVGMRRGFVGLHLDADPDMKP